MQSWKAQSSSSRSSRVRRRLVGPQIPSSIHPWRRGLNSARFRQQEASGFANLAAPLSQALRAASIASRSPAARVRTARFHRASGARKTVAQRGRCGKRRARGFGFFAVAGTNSISGTAIKEGRLFLIGGETAGSTKNDGESRSMRLCRRQEVHFPPLPTHFPSLTSHLSQCTRPTITVPPSCVAPTAHRGTPAQILGRPWSSHPDA